MQYQEVKELLGDLQQKVREEQQTWLQNPTTEFIQANCYITKSVELFISGLDKNVKEKIYRSALGQLIHNVQVYNTDDELIGTLDGVIPIAFSRSYEVCNEFRCWGDGRWIYCIWDLANDTWVKENFYWENPLNQNI